MPDYSKLVEDLRDIEKTMFELGTSPINMDKVSIRLAYDKKWGQIAKDAADAIEALQAEQKKTVTQIFGEEQQKWTEYCTALGNRIKELEQQMPKRGEWKTTRPDAPMFGFYYCSICGRRRTSPQDNYCPNCGAKMEVQE